MESSLGALRSLVDLALASFLLYRAIVLIRGTRSINVVLGLMLLFFLTQMVRLLDLTVTSWLLEQIWLAGVLLFVIVFQPEIRQALAELGKRPFIAQLLPDKKLHFLEEVLNALKELSKNRTGAMIVLEQDMGLRNVTAAGVPIYGEVSKELLLTIFQAPSLLHDGAAVISLDGRLLAARCLIPVAEGAPRARNHGARHQAALTLTQTTDAIIVVVSEETGEISVARNGRLDPNGDLETISRELHDLYQAKIRKGLLRKLQEAATP